MCPLFCLLWTVLRWGVDGSRIPTESQLCAGGQARTRDERCSRRSQKREAWGPRRQRKVPGKALLVTCKGDDDFRRVAWKWVGFRVREEHGGAEPRRERCQPIPYDRGPLLVAGVPQDTRGALLSVAFSAFQAREPRLTRRGSGPAGDALRGGQDAAGCLSPGRGHVAAELRETHHG